MKLSAKKIIRNTKKLKFKSDSFFFYRKSQWWNRERIERYQDERLISLIKHAYAHVPYYTHLFKEIGLDPRTFKGREDMHKIPLLDKDTLRKNRDQFIALNAESFGINYDSTSGSTGTPLQLVIDDLTEANKISCLVRSYLWAGYSIRKKSFGLQSYLKKSYPKDAGLIVSKSMNVYRFDSNNLNKERAIRLADELNVIKPKFYYGYPLPLTMLGRYASDAGIKLHSPDSIIVYGETLSRARRALLESYYHTKIYDFYSLHECSAIISDCDNGNYHWMEDFAFNEVVDSNGAVISEGTGELIGTSFYNYAMPLIRYKIRDYVEIAPIHQKCACGREFQIVNDISGRQNDYIQTPDGRILGNVMEHSIDKAVGVTLSQCVQDSVDHVYINLVVDKNYDKTSETYIIDALRKRLGEEIKIDFKLVDELEKTKGGKTPFILSKLGNEYV